MGLQALDRRGGRGVVAAAHRAVVVALLAQQALRGLDRSAGAAPVQCRVGQEADRHTAGGGRLRRDRSGAEVEEVHVHRHRDAAVGAAGVEVVLVHPLVRRPAGAAHPSRVDGGVGLVVGPAVPDLVRHHIGAVGEVVGVVERVDRRGHVAVDPADEALGVHLLGPRGQEAQRRPAAVVGGRRVEVLEVVEERAACGPTHTDSSRQPWVDWRDTHVAVSCEVSQPRRFSPPR